jgi:hypothetical protein
MARRPRAAPFRTAQECQAEARLRRAVAGVEALLQPVEVEAAPVLPVRPSGPADRPGLEARSAAAAHMRRLGRKRRSEPKRLRRIYDGSGIAWPIPVWWSRLISITFLSPLHRVFANVSNPAPMHWRFAIFQRQKAERACPPRGGRTAPDVRFVAGYCSGTLAAATSRIPSWSVADWLVLLSILIARLDQAIRRAFIKTGVFRRSGSSPRL